MSETPSPLPPDALAPDAPGATAQGRAGFHFPPLNRRNVIRLIVILVVCCAVLGGLFAVLLTRRGGRAASGPVVISALPPPVETRPDDTSAPSEPQGPAAPAAFPFSPALGVPGRFERRIRFTPPILPVDTGSFEADGIIVTIADMEPPAFERVCYDDNRALWACGRYARAALFNRIRNGALVCQARGSGGLWACEHNGEDIALWMIRLGWARPAPGSPIEYAGAMAEAQAAKAGLWNGGWRYYALSGPAPTTPPTPPRASGSGGRLKPAPR